MCSSLAIRLEALYIHQNQHQEFLPLGKEKKCWTFPGASRKPQFWGPPPTLCWSGPDFSLQSGEAKVLHRVWLWWVWVARDKPSLFSFHSAEVASTGNLGFLGPLLVLLTHLLTVLSPHNISRSPWWPCRRPGEKRRGLFTTPTPRPSSEGGKKFLLRSAECEGLGALSLSLVFSSSFWNFLAVDLYLMRPLASQKLSAFFSEVWGEKGWKVGSQCN